MSSINDGGQVFPQTLYSEDSSRMVEHTVKDGMTLRDWFAGQALAGMNPSRWSEGKEDDIARRCCKCADALLAELSRPQQGEAKDV